MCRFRRKMLTVYVPKAGVDYLHHHVIKVNAPHHAIDKTVRSNSFSFLYWWWTHHQSHWSTYFIVVFNSINFNLLTVWSYKARCLYQLIKDPSSGQLTNRILNYKIKNLKLKSLSEFWSIGNYFFPTFVIKHKNRIIILYYVFS